MVKNDPKRVVTTNKIFLILLILVLFFNKNVHFNKKHILQICFTVLIITYFKKKHFFALGTEIRDKFKKHLL